MSESFAPHTATVFAYLPIHLYVCTCMYILYVCTYVHALQKTAAIEVNYLDKHTLSSPLMAAVSGGEVDKVKSLLRMGADSTMGDSEGFSALFYAIYTEQKQNVSGTAQLLWLGNVRCTHVPTYVGVRTYSMYVLVHAGHVSSFTAVYHIHCLQTSCLPSAFYRAQG